MSLKETIKRILLEEVTPKQEMLRKMAKDNGLETAFKIVGGAENYIKFAYDGDIKEYYKNENVRPYYIREGDEINMYFDNALVEHLNLEDLRDGVKKLGEFTFGKANGIKFKFDARLMRMDNTGRIVGWRVVGLSGSYGFGYFGISKKETLGKTFRKQIFQQIIDKYNLEDYN